MTKLLTRILTIVSDFRRYLKFWMINKQPTSLTWVFSHNDDGTVPSTYQSSLWSHKTRSFHLLFAFNYLADFFKAFLPQPFAHKESVYSFKLFQRSMSWLFFLHVRNDYDGGKQSLRWMPCYQQNYWIKPLYLECKQQHYFYRGPLIIRTLETSTSRRGQRDLKF